MKPNFKHLDLYIESLQAFWANRRIAVSLATGPFVAFMAIATINPILAGIISDSTGRVMVSVISTFADALIDAYLAERWISILNSGKIFPPLNRYITENGKLVAMLLLAQSAAVLSAFPAISGLVFHFNIADMFPLALIVVVLPVCIYITATVLKYSVLVPLLAVGIKSLSFADIKKVVRGNEMAILGMTVLIYAPLILMILLSGTKEGLSIASIIGDGLITALSIVCTLVWFSYLTKLAQKLRILPSFQ